VIFAPAPKADFRTIGCDVGFGARIRRRSLPVRQGTIPKLVNLWSHAGSLDAASPGD